MINRQIFVHASEFQLSRFLANVEVLGHDWMWTGKVSPTNGYGLFSIRGQWIGAHRAAFEWANGPIFSWMETDHLCRKPLCVRPDHMEAVTHLENVRRGKTAAALRANPHPLAKHLLENEISLQQFAESMRTSVVTIRKMLTGYRPIGDPELVYRVGDALQLSWEETDRAFPRKWQVA